MLRQEPKRGERLENLKLEGIVHFKVETLDAMIWKKKTSSISKDCEKLIKIESKYNDGVIDNNLINGS